MNTPNPDPVWESDIYSQGRHLNLYPFDAVVSFLFRWRPRDKPRGETSVLEIGCGAGNNLWFAAREGFRVAGIDGSESAISFARERFAAENLEGDLRVGLIVNPSGMPELMKWSDLAVAAGGSTAWELSFMGVPGLYFILAENQRAIAMHLEKKGLGICLQGLAEEREFSRLSAEVAKLSADFQRRVAFSKNCRSTVDGYGAQRIVEILKGKA